MSANGSADADVSGPAASPPSPGTTAPRAPAIPATNAAVYKNIRLGKSVKLQLRAEVFNVFNRTNFLVGNEVAMTWTPENVVFDTGDPTTATRIISATPSGSFGQLNDSADNRQAQFGIRLSF